MAIHAPAHPSGVMTSQVHHHYLAWFAVAVAIILAIGALLVAPNVQPATTVQSEAQRLVEFRAAEHAAWIAGQLPPSIRLGR
jgi:hypothetical protein